MDYGADLCDDLGTMQRIVRLLAFRRHREIPLVRVCAEGEIADGEIRRVTGLPAVVGRAGGRLYAFGLACPHAGARMTKAAIVGDCVECPLHGARFALDGGEVRRGPAVRPLPAYDVVVREGVVYVSRRPRRRRRADR